MPAKPTASSETSAAIPVLLAQFNALRGEIAERSKAQATFLSLAITALGALGSLGFSPSGDKRLLLLIPMVSVLLGLLWLDHAANISNLGDFIKDEIMPALRSSSGRSDLPDYEVFIRGYEVRPAVILRSFGLPPFLTFLLAPVVATVLAFDAPVQNWVFWTMTGVDVALLVLCLAYWAPFLGGPRATKDDKGALKPPTGRGAPPTAFGPGDSHAG